MNTTYPSMAVFLAATEAAAAAAVTTTEASVHERQSGLMGNVSVRLVHCLSPSHLVNATKESVSTSRWIITIFFGVFSFRFAMERLLRDPDAKRE